MSDDCLWWLSFCDPQKPKGSQFLGVSIVLGANILDAAQTAWAFGCNPGGELHGEPFWDDETKPPPAFLNRLLSRAEVHEMERLMRAVETAKAGSE